MPLQVDQKVLAEIRNLILDEFHDLDFEKKETTLDLSFDLEEGAALASDLNEPEFKMVSMSYSSSFLAQLEQEVEEELKQAEVFNQVLFQLMDQRGYQSDADFYRKAGIEKQHFSKIRSNEQLIPKRTTILAIALALELSLSEAERLLSTVGYSFMRKNKTDLVVKYCLEHGIYDRFQVNFILDDLGLDPL